MSTMNASKLATGHLLYLYLVPCFYRRVEKELDREYSEVMQMAEEQDLQTAHEDALAAAAEGEVISTWAFHA